MRAKEERNRRALAAKTKGKSKNNIKKKNKK